MSCPISCRAIFKPFVGVVETGFRPCFEVEPLLFVFQRSGTRYLPLPPSAVLVNEKASLSLLLAGNKFECLLDKICCSRLEPCTITRGFAVWLVCFVPVCASVLNSH